MSKHIKGPWGYWPNCCREGGMVTVTRGGQHIAAPTFFPNDQDVTLANAILLAAAPELLEALIAATEEIESRDRGFLRVNGVPFEGGVSTAELRDAIEKATGK